MSQEQFAAFLFVSFLGGGAASIRVFKGILPGLFRDVFSLFVAIFGWEIGSYIWRHW